MDSRRFDALTKSVSALGTRRAAVRLLSILPLGVTLTAVLGEGLETTAKKKGKGKKKQAQPPPGDDRGSSGRRHRRKAGHKHDPGKDKEHRPGNDKGHNANPSPPEPCVPDSLALTCAGKCATVT